MSHTILQVCPLALPRSGAFPEQKKHAAEQWTLPHSEHRFREDGTSGAADTLSSPTPSEENAAYIVQTDPYFGSIKDWGKAIWELWLHNDGAPPFEMTATISRPIVEAIHLESDGLHIDFQTMTGRSYSLQARDDLTTGDWITIDGPVEGDGNPLTWIDTDASTHAHRIYRLVSTVEE